MDSVTARACFANTNTSRPHAARTSSNNTFQQVRGDNSPGLRAGHSQPAPCFPSSLFICLSTACRGFFLPPGKHKAQGAAQQSTIVADMYYFDACSVRWFPPPTAPHSAAQRTAAQSLPRTAPRRTAPPLCKPNERDGHGVTVRHMGLDRRATEGAGGQDGRTTARPGLAHATRTPLRRSVHIT